MNKKLPKGLVNIATKARSLAEKFAKNNSFIGDKRTLQCYCAISSKIFYKMARRAKYKVNIIQGNFGKDYYPDNYNNINHCWIEYGNYIIDITATQFGIKDKIYIIEKNKTDQYLTVRDDGIFISWHAQDPEEYKKEINDLIKASKASKTVAVN